MFIDPEQYKKDLSYTTRDNRNQLLQRSGAGGAGGGGNVVKGCDGVVIIRFQYVSPIGYHIGGADTASVPSFTWSGNTNTGLYKPNTNQIGFTCNGTNVATFSNGNLTVNGTITANNAISGTTINGASITSTSFNGASITSTSFNGASLTSTSCNGVPIQSGTIGNSGTAVWCNDLHNYGILTGTSCYIRGGDLVLSGGYLAADITGWTQNGNCVIYSVVSL
jgi:hypothetical protein